MRRIGVYIIAVLLMFSIVTPYKTYGVEGLDFNVQNIKELEGKIIVISPDEKMVIKKVNITERDKFISDEKGVMRAWLYTMDVTTYTILDADEEIPPTRYVSRYIGFEDPAGNPYYASGTVYHVGTAYNFPSVGKKEAVYEGTLSCYIY